MKTRLVLFLIMISFPAVKAQEKKKEAIPDPREFIAVQKEPRPLEAVKPVYPEEALIKKLDGKVIIRALVDKDGKVIKTQVVMSSNKIFEQPAIDAIMKTKFSPAIQDEKPIMCWINLPYLFDRQPKTDGVEDKAAVKDSKKSKKK